MPRSYADNYFESGTDSRRSQQSGRRVAAALLGVVFSATLAATLFGAGFFLCAAPATTPVLSRLTSDFDKSAYLPDDTVELARATRDFTVEPYRLGEQTAADVLAEAVLSAARHSSAKESIKSPEWQGVTVPAAQAADRAGDDTSPQADEATQQGGTLSLDLRNQNELPSGGAATSAQSASMLQDTAEAPSLAAMYVLAESSSRFALEPDEISHLVDCNRLINTAVPVLVVIAAIALASGIALFFLSSRSSFGVALRAAPSLLLAAMVALAIWALVDFSGFFSAFHGLFFPQGNWTFPSDSLLICMLPTRFWIGMAAIWAVATIALSAACIIVGRRLMRS